MTGFLPFVAVSVAVIVAPGPDTVLTLRNTFAGGRTAGLFTAAGVVAGQQVWAVAATLGLSATFRAFPEASLGLRLAGGGYLILLGARSILSARVHPERDPTRDAQGATTRLTSMAQGLISNIANPKMLVFFASLLPQFVDPAQPGEYIALAMTFSGLTLAWLTLVAFAFDRIGRQLMTGRGSRFLEGLAGLVLLALGVVLVLSVST